MKMVVLIVLLCCFAFWGGNVLGYKWGESSRASLDEQNYKALSVQADDWKKKLDGCNSALNEYVDRQYGNPQYHGDWVIDGPSGAVNHNFRSLDSERDPK